MLIVATVGRIRREHFVQGKTIREIARDLKLSRDMVRKVLRSAETGFSYGREVQPRPELGRWTEGLDRLLAANAEAPARERLKRPERTIWEVFEEERPKLTPYRGRLDGFHALPTSVSKTCRASKLTQLAQAQLLCASTTTGTR